LSHILSIQVYKTQKYLTEFVGMLYFYQNTSWGFLPFHGCGDILLYLRACGQSSVPKSGKASKKMSRRGVLLGMLLQIAASEDMERMS